MAINKQILFLLFIVVQATAMDQQSGGGAAGVDLADQPPPTAFTITEDRDISEKIRSCIGDAVGTRTQCYFSPDGTKMAFLRSRWTDTVLFMWDLANNALCGSRELAPLQYSYIYGFSSTNGLLFSLSRYTPAHTDESTHMWTGLCDEEISDVDDITRVSLSKDGSCFAYWDGNAIRLKKMETKTEAVFPLDSDTCAEFDLSPNGKKLFVRMNHKEYLYRYGSLVWSRAVIWDVETEKVERELRGHCPGDVIFSNDSSYFVCVRPERQDNEICDFSYEIVPIETSQKFQHFQISCEHPRCKTRLPLVSALKDRVVIKGGKRLFVYDRARQSISVRDYNAGNDQVESDDCSGLVFCGNDVFDTTLSRIVATLPAQGRPIAPGFIFTESSVKDERCSVYTKEVLQFWRVSKTLQPAVQDDLDTDEPEITSLLADCCITDDDDAAATITG